MSYTIRILASDGLAEVTLHGQVDGAELVEGVVALCTHPGRSVAGGSLWDGRGVTSLVLQPNDVEAFVGTCRALCRAAGAPAGRNAIVIRRGLDADVATLLIAKLRPLGLQLRLFRRLPAARAWLAKLAQV